MAERQRDVVLNFRMNGQVQYAQTLKQINMVMQTAAKEYTNQIQSMRKNASQTEKLRAEKQKLQTQMTASSEKVRMLREEFEAMSNDSSATAEDLQKLYNKLLTAENAHTKLEQAMERVNAGLTDEAIAAREVQDELNKLKDDGNTLEAEQRRLTSAFELQRAQLGENASEADRAALAQEQYTQQMNMARRAVDNLEQQLEATRRAYGENSVEVMQLETRLNQARSEMTRFSRGLDDVEESAEGAESKLGMLGRGAQALAGALPAAAVAGLAESTKELSTELSRLQSNAETWGFTGEKIEESFKKVAAVSGDTGAAVETVSNLMATGFDDNQLAEAIEYVNGAYVQFSDTLSTEGIADGIQETFAVGEAAGSFAELLERSGMSLETFNEGLAKAKKNGSETDYVLQTLSDTGVKSFYESYQQSNKALIEANEAEVEHQMALKELGDTLRPLVTDVTQFTTKIIEWASENPELTKGIVIATTAIGALVAVGAVLAPIFTAIATTAGAAGISVGALMTTILPIIAIAAAVVAAIIGIVYAVKNWGEISDWLSKKWDQFTSWISKTTSKLAKDFVKWFNNMKDGAVEKVDELKVKAVRKVVELTVDAVRKGQELKTKFVNKANELKDGAISKFNSLRDGASRVMNQAKDKILSPIQSAKEKISGIVSDIKGFFTGMKLSIPQIKMPKLPKFTISGDFGLNPPRVPKIGIKWNAKGAIFTQPTIFGMSGNMLQGAGEAGPEAALPLNEETLGAIGRGIASTMGTRQPMIIQMVTPDRRVLAEMVVDDVTELQEFNQNRIRKFSKG
ncbi:hypothetical protein MKY20_23695 [Cytobacillus sp. FSL W8-0315]|uniref:hypothetical protein n=1 Tax=Cytobacillus sp. FSL W8-0315 TaxID=2921600 RepID=UPI0030F7495D